MIKAFSSLLDAARTAVASVLYLFRRSKATGVQADALPKSYREYRDYNTTYGVAPGDVVTIDGNVAVVTSLEGPPTINARVEYYDVERGEEYVTGLGNVFRE